MTPPPLGIFKNRLIFGRLPGYPALCLMLFHWQIRYPKSSIHQYDFFYEKSQFETILTTLVSMTQWEFLIGGDKIKKLNTTRDGKILLNLMDRAFKFYRLKLKFPVGSWFSSKISRGIFLSEAGNFVANFSGREGIHRVCDDKREGMFDWKKYQNIYLCGIFLLLGVWGHCSLVSDVDDVICDVIVEDDVIDDVRWMVVVSAANW